MQRACLSHETFGISTLWASVLHHPRYLILNTHPSLQVIIFAGQTHVYPFPIWRRCVLGRPCIANWAKSMSSVWVGVNDHSHSHVDEQSVSTMCFQTVGIHWNNCLHNSFVTLAHKGAQRISLWVNSCILKVITIFAMTHQLHMYRCSAARGRGKGDYIHKKDKKFMDLVLWNHTLIYGKTQALVDWR